MADSKHEKGIWIRVFCAGLVLIAGCKSKESSIYTDQDVIDKCCQIKENSHECGLDQNSAIWLNETNWSLVSRRQKNMVVKTVTEVIAHRESPDYSRAHALSYMDADYRFEPLARLGKSPCYMTRCKVASEIPLIPQYKNRSLDIIVELLFDPDQRVRMGAACSVAQRLEPDEAIRFLLLYYFENIYNNYKNAGKSEHFCDWVRLVAKSEYRGVLFPWIELVTQLRPHSPPLHEWSHYDSPGTWDNWWENAKAEQNEAIVKATKIVRKMKQQYQTIIKQSKPAQGSI